jgi:hypothetical protein
MPIIPHASSPAHQRLPDTAINKLIAAAVVDREFSSLLLANPSAALSLGYHGEFFHLSEEEKSLIATTKASSLTEFASLIANGRNGSCS